MADRQARLVIPGLVQLKSGLIVPAEAARAAQRPEQGQLIVPTPALPDKTLLVVGQPPSDLDAYFAAPDPEALGQPNPSLEAICQTLEEVPVETAMIGLAGIAAAAWLAGTDQARHLKLAEEIYRGRPVLDDLQAFVAGDPHHVVFNEQHLTILMRLLLIHGAEGDVTVDLTDDQVDALLTAMLAVGGLTARHADPEDNGEEPMGWVPWMVRSGLYFDRSNLGSDQGRARALFVDLFADADPDGPHWCDLEAWMAEDLAPMERQLAFGYAMGAFAKAFTDDIPTTERFIAIVPDGLLAGQLEAGEVDRLIAASSASREHYVAAFGEDDDVDHLLWDRTPFERRPFLRLDDGRLVLLSPRFLHSWTGEGVYYRLLDSAMSRPDPRRPQRNAVLRFTQLHGELMERYVQCVTERAHTDQARAGVVQISAEQIYEGKAGTQQKSPDLMLSYATDVVAIEVTGGRPSRRTRVLSDPALIIKELDDRVIDKLTELDKALIDVLDGTVEIPGLRLDLVERVWPLLIVPASIVQTEMVWDHIEQRAPELFTHHPALQRPTFFSIEDYERALAAVDQGAGLPAVLGTRQSSLYARMPPSHFFGRHFKTTRRASYLEEQLRLVGSEAAAALSLGVADE